MKQTKHTVNCLLAILVAIFTPQTSWAEERWFEVELLLFAQPKSEAIDNEYWPTNISLKYPEHWVTLKDPATKKGAKAFYLLPDEVQKLTADKMQLRWSKAHRPLFHEAWRQPVFGKENSPSILISAGKQYDDHRELEGSIQLSVSRYLHLQTNLWFTEFEKNSENTTFQTFDQTNPEENTQSENTTDLSNNVTWPKLPRAPQKRKQINTEIDISTYGSPSDLLSAFENADTTLSTSEIIQEGIYSPTRIAHINQKRRMRSKDLHYIDHPLVGILILITPYELPKPVVPTPEPVVPTAAVIPAPETTTSPADTSQ